MPALPKVSARQVYKSFIKRGGVFHALAGVDLEIGAGEFVALIGPSGCGKSTLLNMVAGIETPVAGQLLYDGQPLQGLNTRVGYMTQSDTVLPWRNALDNVAYPLELRGVDRTERQERARRWLELVGLKGFEHHYPRELSGGMRKRVLLARTLIYEPETILLDEPFGALDAQTRLVMQAELLRLWYHGGGGKPDGSKTVILVTHDLSEAITLADRVVVFAARPGRVKHVEHINLPHPRDVFHIRFTPGFGNYFERLWGLLENEVAKGENL